MIPSRTGIAQRHVAADDETTSTMAVMAARRALKLAGVRAEDLDLIIMGTISPDLPMPSAAVFVQRALGAGRAAAFDVSAACAGSLYAMSIAEKFIRARGGPLRPGPRGRAAHPHRRLGGSEHLRPLRRRRRGHGPRAHRRPGGRPGHPLDPPPHRREPTRHPQNRRRRLGDAPEPRGGRPEAPQGEDAGPGGVQAGGPGPSRRRAARRWRTTGSPPPTSTTWWPTRRTSASSRRCSSAWRSPWTRPW